jgi:hypothetical protein
MPVVHLGQVNDFEECLKSGGTYKFEITIDEMPHLAQASHALLPFEVQDLTTQDLMKLDTTWARIVRSMATLKTVWIYKRSGQLTYEVTCIIPPPTDGSLSTDSGI